MKKFKGTKLMAAAPALLEALQRCDNLFDIIQKREGLGNDNIRWQVKQAINKALK